MITGAGSPAWIRVGRIGFGVLGVVALVWTPARNGGAEWFSLGNYLSFFTVESNILGVMVLLGGGLFDPGGRGWQVVRGAATLYLLITGVVYAVLLANVDVLLYDRWVNHTLHRVLPIVLVVDWLLVSARLRVTARLVVGWMAYPVLYGVYSLIRGAMVGWYPYPFLDPRTQGYPSLLIGLVMFAVVFALMAVAVAGLDARREPRDAPA
ncbi:Pr6Pr family membrane protein [Nocardia transvalensis]|uniref:Pr6Pr family membrane protein n=1 Tax=Nocardia transvalensis TaxID=37333 RepID=UPI001895D764|nr:Pr6Pr family membrane protein [Nocardia transvalensis]MBF6329654.1 Pr6Pr family membrane protein [Nocardia transvalensis]